jgi:adenylate cyclase
MNRGCALHRANLDRAGNAKLFADVQQIKNYNEAMLESMSNGVITLDGQEKIVTCNEAGQRILRTPARHCRPPAGEFFGGANTWIAGRLRRVEVNESAEHLMDVELVLGEETRSVNLSMQPLLSMEKKRIGWMLMIEDISSEKRLRSTMSRYMDPGIADQMVANGAEMLGGKNVPATVLFSDIRSFTTITEQLGAQGTVTMLNEYFTLMVDCIQREEGMLDKFIGDAIMAAFGIPVGHEDDPTARCAPPSPWSTSCALEPGAGRRGQAAGGDRHRAEYRPGGVREYRLQEAHGLHHHRRRREPGGAAGIGLQAVRRAHPDQRIHLPALRGTYRTREVDIVVVKGKTRPVSIYEVLDYHTEDSYPSLRRRWACSATACKATASATGMRPASCLKRCWR